MVSSIQMGATIDYAIVFTNRYLELKPEIGKKAAAIEAINGAFPTILTSGLIMMIAGFLIGVYFNQPGYFGFGKMFGGAEHLSL